jgi:glycosyl transferase family 2
MYLLLLSAWLLTDGIATYGVWHYRRSLITFAPAEKAPKVAILIAIKGVSETTPQFLEALCRQQYPNYRLVFALESRSDSAWPLIDALLRRLAGELPVEMVIAGEAIERAQKVHNLLAAARQLRPDDAIVVFADADTLPDPRWLSQLIRPIAAGEAAASSGYRWLLPADRRWSSLIVAAIDLSIATAARSWRWNLCWGGSVAVDQQALERVHLPALWDRAASDDLTLTAALRVHGLKINAPLRVLVPSPVAHDWVGLFRFARRQYLLVRTYAPKHWLVAGWSVCLPAFAAVLAVAETVLGQRWALPFILGSIALLQLRLRIRRQIADLLLPQTAIEAARATIFFAQWAWPLIQLVHLGAFLTSAAGRRFTWAGIEYRLDGRTVTVERKTGEAEPPP